MFLKIFVLLAMETVVDKYIKNARKLSTFQKVGPGKSAKEPTLYCVATRETTNSSFKTKNDWLSIYKSGDNVVKSSFIYSQK